MRSVPVLLVLALLATAGCGNGNIGDLFSIFPKEAFEGDGDIPGDGEIPLPFQPGEIGLLASGQGVTGDVRNIALATQSGLTYAFLAAGTDGFHVADVTLPDLINTDSYVANVVFWNGHEWHTPLHPLLPGTMRASLLAQGAVRTAIITTDTLARYKKFKLINAFHSLDEAPELQTDALISEKFG